MFCTVFVGPVKGTESGGEHVGHFTMCAYAMKSCEGEVLQDGMWRMTSLQRHSLEHFGGFTS